MQLGELRGRRGQRQPQLLEPPRHTYRPALVAEVPLDLTDDGGGGVGGELHAALRVEAVHGLDQADGGHLGEVVQRLAAVAEPAGQVLDERQVHAHQPIAQLRAYSGVPAGSLRSSMNIARAPLRSGVGVPCVVVSPCSGGPLPRAARWPAGSARRRAVGPLRGTARCRPRARRARARSCVPPSPDCLPRCPQGVGGAPTEVSQGRCLVRPVHRALPCRSALPVQGARRRPSRQGRHPAGAAWPAVRGCRSACPPRHGPRPARCRRLRRDRADPRARSSLRSSAPRRRCRRHRGLPCRQCRRLEDSVWCSRRALRPAPALSRPSRRPGSRAALFVQADRHRVVGGDRGVDFACEGRQHRPGEGVALRGAAVGRRRRHRHF